MKGIIFAVLAFFTSISNAADLNVDLGLTTGLLEIEHDDYNFPPGSDLYSVELDLAYMFELNDFVTHGPSLEFSAGQSGIETYASYLFGNMGETKFKFSNVLLSYELEVSKRFNRLELFSTLGVGTTKLTISNKKENENLDVSGSGILLSAGANFFITEQLALGLTLQYKDLDKVKFKNYEVGVHFKF